MEKEALIRRLRRVGKQVGVSREFSLRSLKHVGDCTVDLFVALIQKLFSITLPGNDPQAKLQGGLDYLSKEVIGV